MSAIAASLPGSSEGCSLIEDSEEKQLEAAIKASLKESQHSNGDGDADEDSDVISDLEIDAFWDGDGESQPSLQDEDKSSQQNKLTNKDTKATPAENWKDFLGSDDGRLSILKNIGK